MTDGEPAGTGGGDPGAGGARDSSAFVGRFVGALTSTSLLVTVLAFLLALVIGALFIAIADEATRQALGYFFARPSDALSAAWTVVGDSYAALFDGALGSTGALSETFTAATPLILTGLAVAIPLRGGMFNIGGEGQVILGATFAGWVGFTFTGLPTVLHLPLAVLAGMVGGLIYGWIPGILKARTGAHEVITTIMLNNIAVNLLGYLLTIDAFQQVGRNDPISEQVARSAWLPDLPGSLRLHAGLFLALAAAAAVWWFVQRSTDGFEINAVGLNPDAARTAGMSVSKATILAMTLAGVLGGLAGTGQVLGLERRLTLGISAGLGFDGITVALLGRGQVVGTVLAGILFGGLKAGGLAMQARTGTSLDLVLVIQSLIILFIAAPALIRAVFRIRAEEAVGGQISQGWGS